MAKTQKRAKAPKTNEKRDTSPVDLALVLGYLATKDLATIEQKVSVLAKLGYSNTEMEKITGAKNQTVRNIKAGLKGARKNA